MIARQRERPADQRGDPRAHLQRRVFGTERVAGADRHRARRELARHGGGGHDAVGDVDGGLGVNDAAALRFREHIADHQGGDDGAERGRDDGRDGIAHAGEAKGGPADRVDCDMKTNDEEAGRDANQDRQQQQELRVAESHFRQPDG